MQAPNNMRQFVDDLESRGELKRISEEVDPYLEVTALSDPVMKATGPALLFERVKGAACPLAINLFGSRSRMAASLGVEDLQEIADRLKGLLEVELPSGGLVAKLMSVLPKLKELKAFAPKTVKEAPCQEVVLTGDEASLDLLPILTCWPDDAGPFITLPQVITADPDTGKHNVGMYRLQRFDARTTGMHWHRHKGGAAHYERAGELGQKLPVAVALGGPPASTYAACAPLPENLPEYMFTGFLMRRPLEVVKAKTSDLMVPAQAEVILEGYVDPAEPLRTEGPFGDHTGYYSLADDYPVFHITAITHRKDFLYPTTIVGIPPMEDYYLGMATERLFLPLIQTVLPEVVDYHMPAEGVFHNLVFVAIDKKHPGQAYKVMNALWGQGQMMFAKLIVVVDADVDVQDPQRAWWEALNHIDPQRDVLFTRGPADALDHAAQLPFLHSKMGIDGTRKLKDEGFTRPWPERIEMTPGVQAAALDRLKGWGLLPPEK
ncbi:MAG: menaquinone biosynthesis decarboxylase [Desulfarculaceae bacterium]|nr:menaquinone biosynthesis decarboxylase [Desulfarculaceae bacterium]MCF8072009.1 menaquinone biosynthesis decarboxylase [Desulfarculaceae bacterium]MCF8101526.1 menaquinone biosynthesis decarboxylase [Desulfarculaceae bacterium]MCF8115076.1 menaquinone biosynthesis decarboxylase [Desulfarculaceae bacterium]